MKLQIEEIQARIQVLRDEEISEADFPYLLMDPDVAGKCFVTALSIFLSPKRAFFLASRDSEIRRFFWVSDVRPVKWRHACANLV